MLEQRESHEQFASDVVCLARSHDTNRATVATLLHGGIPMDTADALLETRDYLSITSISEGEVIGTDRVSIQAVIGAYRAAREDLTVLAGLAKITQDRVSRIMAVRASQSTRLHDEGLRWGTYTKTLKEVTEDYLRMGHLVLGESLPV